MRLIASVAFASYLVNPTVTLSLEDESVFLENNELISSARGNICEKELPATGGTFVDVSV
jgi:hypothetical protein